MLPAFEVVQRLRPFDLMGEVAISRSSPGASTLAALARPSPYATVLADLRHRPERTDLGFTSGRTRLVGWYDARSSATGLDITSADGRATTHRSRRAGRVEARPSRLAVTLTGAQVTLWTRENRRWRARARVDLRERIDTWSEPWLARLHAGHRSDLGSVTRVTAGGFGQLGLRDLRFVTEADGTPVREGTTVWLTATSAGPGGFDTGHASVWRLDLARSPLAPERSGDLFFRRPDRPGVYGDHAIHLVRDAGGWLVATSTWGDFDKRTNPAVRATLAESATDPRHGEHVLDTRELPLPTDGLGSVGVWDPHLLRDGDTWRVGYVSATRFFRFHPCLADGPTLDSLALTAADATRTATEGTTLLRDGDELLVLASDGRDGRRGQRMRFPVLDLSLAETGALAAPYPTNIPWPNLARVDGEWWLVTFDGTPTGGPLLGYGTHGDVVVMRPAAPV